MTTPAMSRRRSVGGGIPKPKPLPRLLPHKPKLPGSAGGRFAPLPPKGATFRPEAKLDPSQVRDARDRQEGNLAVYRQRAAVVARKRAAEIKAGAFRAKLPTKKPVPKAAAKKPASTRRLI